MENITQNGDIIVSPTRKILSGIALSLAVWIFGIPLFMAIFSLVLISIVTGTLSGNVAPQGGLLIFTMFGPFIFGTITTLILYFLFRKVSRFSMKAYVITSIITASVTLIVTVIMLALTTNTNQTSVQVQGFQNKNIDASLLDDPILITASASGAYTHSTLGFKITPPQGWKVYERKKAIPQMTMMNNEIDGADPVKDYATIRVSVGEATNETLNEIVNNKVDGLQDFKLESNKTMLTDNGKTVNIIEGTYSLGIYPLRIKLLFLIDGGKKYIVSGVALSSIWEQKNYDLIFNSAFKTFQTP